MELKFRYFAAPKTEIKGFKGKCECSVCKNSRDCFSNYIWGESSGELEESNFCLDCLHNRNISLVQDTEIGRISDGKVYKFNKRSGDYSEKPSKPPKGFSEESLLEICHTPEFDVNQNCIYRVHCNDFMTYIGRWIPKDFEKFGAGNPEKLFIEMTPEDFNWLWETVEKSEVPSEWPGGEWYYAFQCRHCGKYLGYWDQD